MAKRPGTRKQGAVRPKAKPAKGLKDLEPRGKGKNVKGGIVCVPIIAILIALLVPSVPPTPPPPPPKKLF
jgi:hypothetical protein